MLTRLNSKKIGLLHNHLLYWFDFELKWYNSEDVNSIILTNFFDIGANPVCYNIVSNFMLHSPCFQTRKLNA
jgi:hypothetical protein